MGAPSKKDKIPEEQLATLYRAGFTDKQVAEFYGITEQTINNWKKAHPDFFESLKDWKTAADSEVVQSLYKRACGWADTTGKEYAPDPTSIIFWLKNRQPGEWRDKQEHEHTGKIKHEHTLSEELKDTLDDIYKSPPSE
jgi:DNA-binding XRE family transcriptional regulator